MRLLLYCFVFLTSTAMAQVDTLEFLQRQLAKPLKMEERIDLLNRLSRAYSEISLSSAEQFANEAMRLSVSIHYPKGVAAANNNLGVYSAIQGQYTVSMDYFVKALEIREQLKDVTGISRTLNNISRLYVYEKDFDKALEYSNKALTQLQQVNDPEAIGNAHIILGTIYNGKGDHASALKKFSEARDIFHTNKFRSREGSAFINMAGVHEQQGNYAGALEACFRASDLLGDGADPFVVIELYQAIGSIYGKMKKENEATSNLHRALRMADARGDGNGRLSSRLKLSNMYKTFGRFDSALFYKDAYLSLYDTIFNAEKSKQIAVLEKVYQTERKDQLLEAKNSQIRMQSTIIAVIGFMLVVLSVFGFVVYRFYLNKKRFARELEVLNKEIYDKHEEILTQAEELSEANDEIRRINDNLEQEVLHRAARIKKQNEMLIDYAYFNAHNVRGPLARIMGLTYLMKGELSVERIKEYNQHLSTSAHELDHVVREINLKLQDG
ncbi:tetratricopeptide repeat protein [Chryseolinea lacunae]|uniref:Tetratricopeptide repeat-containing sensor histidine kinase n=1 Tax=Chryseolinea lacunae TaxID=2801331 RepID=A0ABS1KN52_9BACT|nr:tetratricopeptide repeat protein [Chryseolinea lacunae]MBL0740653.1 tetratricopeptide repeat-containing sensor histidine kinase [Chryseolinea lacunae]